MFHQTTIHKLRARKLLDKRPYEQQQAILDEKFHKKTQPLSERKQQIKAKLTLLKYRLRLAKKLKTFLEEFKPHYRPDDYISEKKFDSDFKDHLEFIFEKLEEQFHNEIRRISASTLTWETMLKALKNDIAPYYEMLRDLQMPLLLDYSVIDEKVKARCIELKTQRNDVTQTLLELDKNRTALQTQHVQDSKQLKDEFQAKEELWNTSLPKFCAENNKLENTDVIYINYFAGKLPAARKKLINTPVFGKFAIHEAAAAGHAALVKDLLDYGALPEQADEQGDTAYHLASEYGQIAVLNILHQYAQHEQYYSWQHLMRYFSRNSNFSRTANLPDKQQRTPLHVAIAHNQSAVLEWWLAHDADIGYLEKDTGKTYLHIAAEQGHLNCVRVLLNWKANPLTLTHDRQLPSELAIKQGHAKIGRLLNKAHGKILTLKNVALFEEKGISLSADESQPLSHAEEPIMVDDDVLSQLTDKGSTTHTIVSLGLKQLNVPELLFMAVDQDDDDVIQAIIATKEEQDYARYIRKLNDLWGQQQTFRVEQALLAQRESVVKHYMRLVERSNFKMLESKRDDDAEYFFTSTLEMMWSQLSYLQQAEELSASEVQEFELLIECKHIDVIEKKRRHLEQMLLKRGLTVSEAEDFNTLDEQWKDLRRRLRVYVADYSLKAFIERAFEEWRVEDLAIFQKQLRLQDECGWIDGKRYLIKNYSLDALGAEEPVYFEKNIETLTVNYQQEVMQIKERLDQEQAIYLDADLPQASLQHCLGILENCTNRMIKLRNEYQQKYQPQEINLHNLLVHHAQNVEAIQKRRKQLLRQLAVHSCETIRQVFSGLNEAEEEILFKVFYDVNLKDQESGDTLLHRAIKRDNIKLVVWLLAQGADIFMSNNDNITVLEYALASKNKRYYELVLENRQMREAGLKEELINARHNPNSYLQPIREELEKLQEAGQILQDYQQGLLQEHSMNRFKRLLLGYERHLEQRTKQYCQYQSIYQTATEQQNPVLLNQEIHRQAENAVGFFKRHQLQHNLERYAQSYQQQFAATEGTRNERWQGAQDRRPRPITQDIRVARSLEALNTSVMEQSKLAEENMVRIHHRHAEQASLLQEKDYELNELRKDSSKKDDELKQKEDAIKQRDDEIKQKDDELKKQRERLQQLERLYGHDGNTSSDEQQNEVSAGRRRSAGLF